jgi:type I restriction enzyme S subunit
MAGDWPSVSLGDLVEIQHGYAFAGGYFRDESPGDVLVTPGNFRPGGGFQQGRSKYYAGPVPAAFVLNQGDLIITMTDLSRESDTLGFPARVPAADDHGRFLHNQRLGRVIVRPGVEVDRDYLYYLLCTRQYRSEVLASATGTTVKHTSPSRIGRFRFELPPVAEQQRIARILGALDDKIELNRRTNETLEAIAQALFKSWFVDFGPVRSKAEGRDPGLPPRLADMFADSFDGSELGEIPTGWRAGVLADLAEHPRRGVQPDLVDPSTLYVGLEHMPRGRMVLDDWGGAGALESGKLKFRRGEILFGKLRPYFHKVGVAPIDGICSTDIVVIRPRTDPAFGLVLGIVSSDAFVDYAAAGSTGTRMPRTNWAEMAHFPCAIPPDQVMGSFTDQIRPAIDRVVSSIHESRTLAALRDTLLPKLISGELRVADAELVVEA